MSALRAEAIGVHPVEESGEGCYLVELRVTGDGVLDVGAITQPDDDRPRNDWQVAYDPYQLTLDGASGVELDAFALDVRGESRLAFFFYYLNLARPLQSPLGSMQLPAPTGRPARLRFIRYEPPG